MRARRALGCLLLLILAAAAAAAGAGWWAWRELHRPLAGAPATVQVAPGTDAGTILRSLESQGLVRDDLLARAYLVRVLGDPPLKAGEYRFEAGVSTVEVLDTLIRGEVVQHRVTVVEGLTLAETAEALAEAGFGSRERFLDTMGDPAPIADLDPEAENLEGYLHPETYAFTRGVAEEEIVATMVRTFRRRFEESVRPLVDPAADPRAPVGRVELGAPPGTPTAVQDARDPDRAAGRDAGVRRRPLDEPAIPSEVAAGRRLTLTLRELVTLASIVEREARLDDERPLIAAVYVNRLLAGMGLYADPTVIYALQLRGAWDGNLRRDDLQIDSPYNTYRYGGLPPGPIASPGVESLRAAADPAHVESLYFVSRNDGSHVFAETLREHNRNVAEWQKRYWRERWARERRDEEDPGAPPGDR